jgi:hypothetical protein
LVIGPLKILCKIKNDPDKHVIRCLTGITFNLYLA